MFCDRRNRTHRRAMAALILYTLMWSATIAFAATESVHEGWTLGNILTAMSLVFGVMTALISYIFTSTVRGIRIAQRQDREDRKETERQLNDTLREIFSELKEKRDSAECQREMNRLECYRGQGNADHHKPESCN